MMNEFEMMQQKMALFRKTPAFIDRLLNRTGLLRWAARHSHMTSAREHGKMCLEMLEIEESGFRKEFDKLLVWLEEIGQPEMVGDNKLSISQVFQIAEGIINDEGTSGKNNRKTGDRIQLRQVAKSAPI